MDKSNLSISDIVARNHKKDNKQRAKEHRERKKHYIVQLETELAQLKIKVVKLEAENKQLKAQSKTGSIVSAGAYIDGLLQRLEYESQYALETLPDIMKDNPEQVRFSMIEQANDMMDSYGSCRVQLIKSWFKLIIDNILDDRMKAYFASISNLSFSKFMTLWKPTKLGETKPKRFKTSEENEVVRLIGDIQFSDKILEQKEEGTKFFKKELSKFRSKIQDIVLLRNKILNQLKHLKDYWESHSSCSS